MSLSLFFCGTAVFIQLILGTMVLLKDPGKRANQIFSLQLFLFMLWNLAEIKLILDGISLDGIKTLITPGIFLSFFFCIFSAIYPEYQKDSLIIKNKLSILLFFLPAALMLYLLWSGKLVASFSAINNGFTLSFGKFEFLIKGCIVGYLVYSLSTLSNSRKSAETKIQIRRLRYTFTAMLLPIAAGSIIIAAGKWFIGGQTAYSFGLFPILSILMSTILSYTMLKYNLMEIDLIFSIGLVYTMLTAILAGCMELMQELMQNILNLSGMWAKVISVLIIAAVFSPLKDMLIKLVDQFFGRKTFDSARVMQHILSEMRSSQSVDKMFSRLIKELRLILDFSMCQIEIEGFSTIRIDDETRSLELPHFDFMGLPKGMNDIETTAEHFRSLGEMEKAAAIVQFKEKGVRNFFLLKSDARSYGLLLLGAKTTKVPYAQAEINLVEGICNEAPHLIENFRMIQRLLEKDRSSQEIEWARKMLRAISAPNSQLMIGSLEVIPFTSLSSEIKGDLIDYNKAEKDEFIGIYDAFHHGIQAVLTLNIVFSVFRSEANAVGKLQKANFVLQNFKDQSLCSAVTILKASERRISITMAGNPAPILITPNSARELSPKQNQPIGLSEQLSFSEEGLLLEAGHLILISTNGLLKAFEQVAQISLIEFLSSGGFVSPQDCKDKIIDKLGHKTATDFSDDITFVVAG